jgi:hypothetical protein
MLFETEFNTLPVESLSESDGYVYGVLSKLSAKHSQYQRWREEEEDPRTLVDYIKDFFFSSDTLYHQLPQEALTEFVNFQEGDVRQAIDYMRRYGLYSLYDLFTRKLPKKIDSFFSDSYTQELIPFAIRLEHLWLTQRTLVGLLRLAMAIRENDEASIKAACESVGYSESEVKFLYSGSWSWTAKDVLLGKLRQHLQLGILVGAKDRGGTFVPTIASYGFNEALFLHVLDNINQGTTLGECENPQCKKLFFLTRKSKKFCSARCQALIKVHRYRKKQKVQNERRRAKDRKLPKRMKGK